MSNCTGWGEGASGAPLQEHGHSGQCISQPVPELLSGSGCPWMFLPLALGLIAMGWV